MGEPSIEVFVPEESGIYVPDSVSAQLLGRKDSGSEPARESKRPRAAKEGKREKKRHKRRDRERDDERDHERDTGPELTVPPEILELAERAMKHWDMKVSGMTLAATKPEKGWGAIWRIETNRGPRALKLLHRALERNLFSIYAQEYLVGRKARVAPLVRTRSGQLYAVEGGRTFIVTEWIEGLHQASKVTPEGAAALCYGLGEFHRLSKGYEPPPEAYYATRLHRWPAVYRKMRTKLDWIEHLARAYGEMEASPLLLEVLPRFRKQADEAIARLERSGYSKLVARGEKAWGLVHQDGRAPGEKRKAAGAPKGPGRPHAASSDLAQDLADVAVLQAGGVGLVGVDVHLQGEGRLHPDDHVVERQRPRAAGPHPNLLPVLHAELLGVGRGHVDVPRSDDDAFMDLDPPRGPLDDDPRGALNVAAHPDDAGDSQQAGISRRDLHLRGAPGRSQHPDLRDRTLRPDDGDLLVGGELAGLNEVLLHGEGCARAEQGLHVLLGQVDMPGADVDYDSLCIGHGSIDLLKCDRTTGVACSVERSRG